MGIFPSVFFLFFSYGLGFDSFAGADTGGTDVGTFDRTVEHDLHALKVRHDLAKGFADNFRTGAAFTFDHTASAVFVSCCGCFVA